MFEKFHIPQSRSLEINTIVRLILYPGYLIKDYLEGKREGILPPVTAVLLFFSFYVLIGDALGYKGSNSIEIDLPENPTVVEPSGQSDAETVSEEIITPDEPGSTAADFTSGLTDGFKGENHYEKKEDIIGAHSIIKPIAAIYDWLTLYERPDSIDSKFKQVVATAETWIRGQGVFSFFTDFLLFFPAFWLLFRKRFSLSQSATATAYILCQRCIFKIFAVIVTLGESNSLGFVVGTALLSLVFHQLLSIGWKEGIRKAFMYWICFILVIIVLVLPIVAVSLLVLNFF